MKKVFLFMCSGLGIFILLNCKKEHSFEKATGTLKDSIGNCLPIIISGNYFSDSEPNHDVNYILVQVNVIKTGAYTIQTDLENGFMFMGSGVFTDTGLQSVKLIISGKPILDTITHFTCVFDTSACTFTIDVKTSAQEDDFADMKPNTWEFTDSTHGSFHAGGVIPNPPSLNQQGGYMFNGAVRMSSPYDSILLIAFAFPTATPEPGIYNTDGENYFAFEEGSVGHPTYYISNFTTGGKLLIEVSSYDSLTRFIKAKFSGPAVDGSKNEVYIVRGRFYAKVF